MSSVWNSTRKLTCDAVRLLTILWFLTHFALTFIYTMPLTPLKMTLQPIANAMVGRFFAQNWSFFAPNPTAANYSMLVRPLNEAEWAEAQKGVLPAQGWHDLTLPLLQRFHANRLSAYARLAGPQSSAMRSYLGRGAELGPWIDACANGLEQACTLVDDRTRIAQASGRALLAKIASSFCNERFSGQEYIGVAIRIRHATPPAWSQRNSGDYLVRDLEVGVFRIDRTIAPSGVYGNRQ